jgi:chromosome segregation ATPase
MARFVLEELQKETSYYSGKGFADEINQTKNDLKEKTKEVDDDFEDLIKEAQDDLKEIVETKKSHQEEIKTLMAFIRDCNSQIAELQSEIDQINTDADSNNPVVVAAAVAAQIAKVPVYLAKISSLEAQKANAEREIVQEKIAVKKCEVAEIKQTLYVNTVKAERIKSAAFLEGAYVKASHRLDSLRSDVASFASRISSTVEEFFNAAMKTTQGSINPKVMTLIQENALSSDAKHAARFLTESTDIEKALTKAGVPFQQEKDQVHSNATTNIEDCLEQINRSLQRLEEAERGLCKLQLIIDKYESYGKGVKK